MGTKVLPVDAACEEQMVLLKREYFPALSREHGLEEQYLQGCKVRGKAYTPATLPIRVCEGPLGSGRRMASA